VKIWNGCWLSQAGRGAPERLESALLGGPWRALSGGRPLRGVSAR